MSQWWRRAGFVHWRLDPAAVAPLLPAGLRPDVFDGAGYVGLVAFEMARTRVLGSPPVPYWGTLAETNVRLYSVDAQGRRGVVFLSMDAARALPVMVARLVLGLPYRWSRMRIVPEGDRIEYSCQPGRTGTSSLLSVEVGERIARPVALEQFLTARWGIHLGARYLATEHSSWPLYRARLLRRQDDLLAMAGLPGIADQPPVSVLYSPGVYARFGAVV